MKGWGRVRWSLNEAADADADYVWLRRGTSVTISKSVPFAGRLI